MLDIYQCDDQSTVQVLLCGQHELRGHGDADHRPHPERAAGHHQVHQHLISSKHHLINWYLELSSIQIFSTSLSILEFIIIVILSRYNIC